MIPLRIEAGDLSKPIPNTPSLTVGVQNHPPTDVSLFARGRVGAAGQYDTNNLSSGAVRHTLSRGACKHYIIVRAIDAFAKVPGTVYKTVRRRGPAATSLAINLIGQERSRGILLGWSLANDLSC